MAKRGLGKGLGALIPTAESSPAHTPVKEAKPTKQAATATPGISTDVASYAEIDVEAVRPNPQQPRQVFDEDALAALVAREAMIGVALVSGPAVTP